MKTLVWEQAEGWQTYAKIISQFNTEDAEEFKAIFHKARSAGLLRTYLTQQGTSHVKDAAASCVLQVGQQAQALKLCVTQYALTMGLNDTFFVVLIGCAVCTALAFFIGRDPAIEAAKAAKKRGETVEQPPVPVMSE